jgi:hypothetical protein
MSRLADAASPPQHPRDPRLDPYRDRTGLLTDEAGTEFATVFVRVETWWTQVGGFLWWRKWASPRDVPQVFYLIGGHFEDSISRAGTIEQDLADWSRGVFRYQSQVLQFAYVAPPRSSVISASAFTDRRHDRTFKATRDRRRRCPDVLAGARAA